MRRAVKPPGVVGDGLIAPRSGKSGSVRYTDKPTQASGDTRRRGAGRHERCHLRPAPPAALKPRGPWRPAVARHGCSALAVDAPAELAEQHVVGRRVLGVALEARPLEVLDIA